MDNSDKLKRILKAFSQIKGNKFVGIKNYTSKPKFKDAIPQKANFIINIGTDVMRAKEKDFQAYKEFDISAIKDFSKFTEQDLKLAYAELLKSSEQNLSKEIEKRTAASQAQTNTYIHICKGIKIHKETLDIYIEGFEIKKEITQKGQTKTVKSRVKTIAKKEIEKSLNLRMKKFRNFTLNFDNLNISGDTIEMI